MIFFSFLFWFVFFSVFVCFCKALWNVFKIDFLFLTWVQLPTIIKVDCFNHNVWQKHVFGSMRPEVKFSGLGAFGILSWTWVIHLSQSILQGNMRFSKPISKDCFRKLRRKEFHFIKIESLSSHRKYHYTALRAASDSLHFLRLEQKEHVLKCANVLG